MKNIMKYLESLNKVGDLENVSISENSLSKQNKHCPESIKSLIHLIKVGEEIAKFRVC
jgi:hypothetical protein